MNILKLARTTCRRSTICCIFFLFDKFATLIGRSNKPDRTQELLAAVIQNRTDTAISILKRREYDRKILKDIRLEDLECTDPEFEYIYDWEGYDVPIPLYMITSCLKILLDFDDWREELMPMILENRKDCERMLDYWESRFGFPAREEVDFRPHRKICRHFEEWFDFEDLMDGTPEQLEQKGYNLDEEKLCYAVLTYDRDVIDEQLAKGTNPNVFISGQFTPDEAVGQYGETYNALDKASDCVGDMYMIFDLGRIFHRDTALTENKRETIFQIFEAAAYEQLYRRLLLNKRD